MRNKENISIEDVKKEIKKMSPWSYFLTYGIPIVLIIVLGILFGIAVSAVVMLLFSGFFAGYLAVAYTTSFEIAKFAKSVAMLLGIIGIILLFISLGWWGIAGIFGYWLWIALSMRYWYKHARFRIT